MGGRYLVTGVQLALLEMEDKHDINKQKLLDEITEKQFVFDSDKNIAKDVEKITNICKGKV